MRMRLQQDRMQAKRQRPGGLLFHPGTLWYIVVVYKLRQFTSDLAS